MNCQQNCNKLKKISKLGLIRNFSEIELEKTLGSAWKIRVGRVSGNKQLFFYALFTLSPDRMNDTQLFSPDAYITALF